MTSLDKIRIIFVLIFLLNNLLNAQPPPSSTPAYPAQQHIRYQPQAVQVRPGIGVQQQQQQGGGINVYDQERGWNVQQNVDLGRILRPLRGQAPQLAGQQDQFQGLRVRSAPPTVSIPMDKAQVKLQAGLHRQQQAAQQPAGLSVQQQQWVDDLINRPQTYHLSEEHQDWIMRTFKSAMPRGAFQNDGTLREVLHNLADVGIRPASLSKHFRHRIPGRIEEIRGPNWLNRPETPPRLNQPVNEGTRLLMRDAAYEALRTRYPGRLPPLDREAQARGVQNVQEEEQIPILTQEEEVRLINYFKKRNPQFDAAVVARASGLIDKTNNTPVEDVLSEGVAALHRLCRIGLGSLERNCALSSSSIKTHLKKHQVAHHKPSPFNKRESIPGNYERAQQTLDKYLDPSVQQQQEQDFDPDAPSSSTAVRPQRRMTGVQQVQAAAFQAQQQAEQRQSPGSPRMGSRPSSRSSSRPSRPPSFSLDVPYSPPNEGMQNVPVPFRGMRTRSNTHTGIPPGSILNGAPPRSPSPKPEPMLAPFNKDEPNFGVFEDQSADAVLRRLSARDQPGSSSAQRSPRAGPGAVPPPPNVLPSQKRPKSPTRTPTGSRSPSPKSRRSG